MTEQLETVTLEEVLAMHGMVNAEEQRVFVDLGREIYVLQRRFESWQQLWEHNLDETLAELTADTRPRVENMVRLARRLRSFRANGPLPDVVTHALNEAAVTLDVFARTSLPARVLH
jgi:hypothetical protein